ncbi:hypothetical protein LguiA_026377 [Lonicera macranthoides]
MAESFVFHAAGQILGKLTTLAFREIGLIWGVKKDFKRLQLTVSAIKAVLLDAAEQKKKNRQVEDWLEKLQDVFYDVGDLLDDIVTEDLRRKVVIKGSKRKAVKNFFSSSNSVALRITMSRKLKNIRSRLEDIDADRKKFELVERAPDSLVAYPLREQTHSFIRASDWMAHGFIQSSNGSWQLEDIGNQYFHELLSRSFFQYESISFDSTLITVKMHDLVHDLALSVAGKDVSRVNYDTRNIFEGTRHLLFSAVRSERKEFPNFLLKLNKVRSFYFEFEVGPISKTFVDTLIKTFSCLRILDLIGSMFEELPDFVGSLKHLKYLDLESNRNIKALPNTICNLVNLQTLYLNDCVMLQDLPRDFGNLPSLRTLCLTSKMTCFPKKEHADGLKSLRYLSIESCDHLESLLGGMKNFTALRYLNIYKCPNLTSLPAESIKYLTSLEILSICQCKKLDLLAEEDTMMELPRGLYSLELEDIPKLKELPRGFENAATTIKYITIRDCPSFEILPEWLQNCASLTKLQLVNCVLLKSVPLGMHQLTAIRELHIQNCSKNLIEKCKWETGKYWPCISQTPENYLRGLKSKNYH